MPVYEFKCDSCNARDDVFISIDSYVSHFPCGYTYQCTGIMERQWIAPGIGMVGMAGNSPPRPSRG